MGSKFINRGSRPNYEMIYIAFRNLQRYTDVN